MSELKNVSHTIDSDVLDVVEKIAESENRSRSNQIEVLLKEAIAARK